MSQREARSQRRQASSSQVDAPLDAAAGATDRAQESPRLSETTVVRPVGERRTVAALRRARLRIEVKKKDIFQPKPGDLDGFSQLLESLRVDEDDRRLADATQDGPLRPPCALPLVTRLSAAWPYIARYAVVDAVTFFPKDDLVNASTRLLHDQHDEQFQVRSRVL